MGRSPEAWGPVIITALVRDNESGVRTMAEQNEGEKGDEESQDVGFLCSQFSLGIYQKTTSKPASSRRNIMGPEILKSRFRS